MARTRDERRAFRQRAVNKAKRIVIAVWRDSDIKKAVLQTYDKDDYESWREKTLISMWIRSHRMVGNWLHDKRWARSFVSRLANNMKMCSHDC